MIPNSLPPVSPTLELLFRIIGIIMIFAGLYLIGQVIYHEYKNSKVTIGSRESEKK